MHQDRPAGVYSHTLSEGKHQSIFREDFGMYCLVYRYIFAPYIFIALKPPLFFSFLKVDYEEIRQSHNEPPGEEVHKALGVPLRIDCR